jgi:ubiquinone/menaquinone biosynthesis C-methylase UbiE
VETDHTQVEQRLLDEVLRPDVVALDAGCGRTTRLRHYRDRIVRLVGADVDDEAGRANPYVDEYVHADLDEALPFDDGSFDLVYANFVVEHLARPGHTFAEWRRVLKPEGALVVLTSNRASPLMGAADRLPQGLRLSLKRRGAGVDERDVYATRYLANTPARLEGVAASAGFEQVDVVFVATAHRYGARIPGASAALRAVERMLPPARRSTIVAAYRPLPVRNV